MDYIIKKMCFKCMGVGVWEGRDPCPICDGIGVITLPEGGRGSALQYVSLPNNVFHANEIYEATTDEDFEDLDAGDDDKYFQLLSLGILDLNAGTRARVKLWNWFGSETDTRANLLSLLG